MADKAEELLAKCEVVTLASALRAGRDAVAAELAASSQAVK